MNFQNLSIINLNFIKDKKFLNLLSNSFQDCKVGVVTTTKLWEEGDTVWGPSKQNLNYSIQDIKILKDDNDETVRAYGNIIVETVQKYAKLNSEDELSVFEKALRYEDPELLESLQGSVLMYRSLADDFVSISVPGGLVSVHLDIINGYENIADSLENMVKIFEDPILSAVGVNSYVIAVDSQVALTVPIQEYFLDRNIVFNPGEAGAVWNIF